MRKYLAALAVFGLALAGCGTVGEDEATITNSKPPTSTSQATSSATETSSTDEAQVDSSSDENPEAEPAAEDANTPQGPQIASCATDPMLYERGTTWFTDGTSGWTQTCADQMPVVTQDLSDVAIADGGTCPAYRCGYGHDANGNPNPTSGEIQAQYGCEQGYITDPALCGAVEEKLGGY